MLFLYSFSAILSSPNKSTTCQLFFCKVTPLNGNSKFPSSKSIFVSSNTRHKQIDWCLNVLTVYFSKNFVWHYLSVWIDLKNIFNHLIFTLINAFYEHNFNNWCYNCLPLVSAYFFFFLTAIWLSHGQLWAIFEGTASLTRC